MQDGDDAPVRRIYSKDIGSVLDDVAGTRPAYPISGDEIYVRAKVISSKPKENPYKEGEMEAAWIQPIVIGQNKPGN